MTGLATKLNRIANGVVDLGRGGSRTARPPQIGYTVMGGTSEIQRNIIAWQGLGMPRV